MYQVLLFIHIFGVTVMFAGIGITVSMMMGMLSANKVESVRFCSAFAVKADGLLPFSVFLILLPGLYLAYAQWGFKSAWIDVSMVTLIGMTLMGPIINLKRLKAVFSESEKQEGLTVHLVEKVKNKVLWRSVFVMTMLAVGMIFLMALKLDWTGSLVAIVVSAVLGVILADLSLSKAKISAVSASTAQKENHFSAEI